MKNNLKNLAQTIIIYNQDRGMEFGIEKFAMLLIQEEKRETTERIELSDQEYIKTLGIKENYKIPRNVKYRHHQAIGREIKTKK